VAAPLVCEYEDWIARSNSNGGVWYLDGVKLVYVDAIPADAPQDWLLGPTMRPGEFGAFLPNAIHPRGHSPYAFAVGKTEEAACGQVSGFFRRRADGASWRRL
jgi:hypothetical protein